MKSTHKVVALLVQPLNIVEFKLLAQLSVQVSQRRARPKNFSLPAINVLKMIW